MDLTRFSLNLVRRWFWLLLLAPLVAGLYNYRVTQKQPDTYVATVRLLIGPGINSANPDLNSLRTGGQLMHTYAEMVTTQPFLQGIVDTVDVGGMSPSRLSKNITVIPNDATQILTIRVQDKAPARVVTIANAIGQALVDLSPSSENGPNAEFRAGIRAQIVDVQATIDSTEARIEGLEAALEVPVADAQAPAPTADPLVQGMIASTQARITQLESDLATAVDPKQQRDIIDQILNERKRLAELQTTDTRTVTTQAQQQKPILDQLSQERTRLSDAQKTLALLYQTLGEGGTNQVRLIEPADSAGKLGSQLQLKTLMGALSGLVVALALALVVEYLDDTIKAREDVPQAADVPALGAVAKYKALPGAGRERLIVEAQPASSAAESYRLLGTQVLFHEQDARPLRALLVSSPLRDAENTEVAANLAVTLAQAGNRVILMDANLRHPLVSQMFGVESQPGLAASLNGASPLPEPVAVDWSPNLSVLPGDSTLPNPFELLASPRMASLIEHLKGKADLLIITAAPLMAFADSLILASHVDGVILVTGSGQTRRKTLTSAVESLRSLGVQVLGVVLNQNRRSVKPLAGKETSTKAGRWPGVVLPRLGNLGSAFAGKARLSPRPVAASLLAGEALVPAMAIASPAPIEDALRSAEADTVAAATLALHETNGRHDQETEELEPDTAQAPTPLNGQSG
ncbi:MAG: polysaccharide biosynthesis tyrosine autokinase [Anaerolineales bacterium]